MSYCVKTTHYVRTGLISTAAKLRSAVHRAKLNHQIRAFFNQRSFLEVETPVISRAASTEVHLASIRANPFYEATDHTGYLVTSPEYAMKRVLAQINQPIFQLTKSFRSGERSARHNPEFTMLEWYRPNAGLGQIQEDLMALIEPLFNEPLPLIRLDYAEQFELITGLNPHGLNESEAIEWCQANQIDIPGGLDRLGLIELIFATQIEPDLGFDASGDLCAHVIEGFLPEQASLARLTRNAQGAIVTERFELYIGGLEIANAANELTDSAEQLARFKQDNLTRLSQGLPAMPVDQALIKVLDQLPPCSGIALGVDRLLMLITGSARIDDVLWFTSETA